ncbi:hypothetical protein [Streptomyces sp. NPDC049040]|uniref:hypothetical protein n=1 Tax=Streptomyces sp. NPDC049040 TaxID=3365593 RepID=UPI0037156477
MIAHSDNGPGSSDPDDPLTILLRPTPEYAGAPAGRYQAIRRKAARRRLLRTAAGVGVSCAVAAIVTLPLLLKSAQDPASPASPAAPAAPPTATGPVDVPRPWASPAPVRPHPTPTPTRTRTLPTHRPSTSPTSRTVEPSAIRGGGRAVPRDNFRR